MKAWLNQQSRRLYRLLRHPRYRRGSRLHDWVARHVFDRELWSPEERRVAAGVSSGLFICMLPIPLQMFVAVAVAIRFRWNIPSAALACWVTSPITWPITYLPAFLLGIHLTGADPIILDDLRGFNLDAFFSHAAENSWQLLAAALLGCLVVGSTLAALGYLATRAFYLCRKPPPPPSPRPRVAAS